MEIRIFLVGERFRRPAGLFGPRFFGEFEDPLRLGTASEIALEDRPREFYPA